MKYLLLVLTLLFSMTAPCQTACLYTAINASQRAFFAQYGVKPGFAAGCMVVQADTGIVYEWDGLIYHIVGPGGGGTIPSGVAGGTLYYISSSSLGVLAAGTSGQVLTSGGAGSPTWAASSGGANTALSNLTNPTAINQSLKLDTDNLYSIGTTAIRVNTTSSRRVNSNLINFYQTADFSSGPIAAVNSDNSGYDLDISSTAGGTGSNAGGMRFRTGDNASGTKPIDIVTGNASGGNSADITMTIGTASGSRGHLKYVDGSQGTAGQVLTSTDTLGHATWAAPSAGFGEYHVGPTMNTTSTNVTSMTFTTASNSGTLTFTPTHSGSYEVFANTPLFNQLPTIGCLSQIAATAGSPTQTENQGVVTYQGTTSTITTGQARSVFTLNSGTSYSFDIQIATGGINNCALEYFIITGNIIARQISN